jgi:glycosyltransferase involved in cell wall biosynthesis
MNITSTKETEKLPILEKKNMKRKIRILFLGNMNNLPYYIAKGLKKNDHFSITFYVDAPKTFLLDRPESWDKSFGEKYPDWIHEYILPDRLKAFRFALPKIFFKKIIAQLNDFDVIFLNGYWVSLGKFIAKDKLVIDIFAGFDLDIMNEAMLPRLIDSFYKQKGRKVIPRSVVKYFYRKLIANQRAGIRRADIVNYYPTGVNPLADKDLQTIKEGQPYKRLELRGFDCDKFPFIEPVKKEKFVILNITRFFFLNDRNDNKRNDIMIKGIAKFIALNNIKDDVEIIFFEKGDDLEAAKKLCDEVGISRFIRWEKETSVEELKNFFGYCDVAFDQLGGHWIGAGLFSMLIGRPMIANERPEVLQKITNEVSPVCQSVNEEDVCRWLTLLYNDRNKVREIGIRSREYVLKYYSLERTAGYFESQILETFS